MTDKYINKKWIDTKMKYDPLFLFEKKREKFDKWLRKRTGGVEVVEQPTIQKQTSVPTPKVTPVQPAIPKMPEIGDLISFNS